LAKLEYNHSKKGSNSLLKAFKSNPNYQKSKILKTIGLSINLFLAAMAPKQIFVDPADVEPPWDLWHLPGAEVIYVSIYLFFLVALHVPCRAHEEL